MNWRRSFRNARNGATIAAIATILIAVAAPIVASLQDQEAESGWERRSFILVIGGVAWGALIGFCATRPADSQSKWMRVFLILLSTIASVIIALLVAGVGNIGESRPLILFAGGMALIAAMFTSYAQFLPDGDELEEDNEEDEEEPDEEDAAPEYD